MAYGQPIIKLVGSCPAISKTKKLTYLYYYLENVRMLIFPDQGTEVSNMAIMEILAARNGSEKQNGKATSWVAN